MSNKRPKSTGKVFIASLSLVQAVALIIALFPFVSTHGQIKSVSEKNRIRKPSNVEKQKMPANFETSKMPAIWLVESVSAFYGYDGRVLVAWRDGGAKSSLGFNVWRENYGRYSKLNSDLIAGATFNFAPRESEAIGGNFVWWDDARTPERYVNNLRYWVEYIGIDGQTRWFGPVVPEKQNRYKVDLINSRLITDITPTNVSQQDVLPEITAEKANSKSKDIFTKQSPESIQDTQWDVAAAPAAKLMMNRTNWTKIPRASLEAAGVNMSNPNNVRLFEDGVEIAANVTAGGDVEFYGRNKHTVTTDRRVYWVSNISQPGSAKRIQQINAGPFDGSIGQGNFMSTIERKDRFTRIVSLLNGDADNFFGGIISSTSLSQSIQIHGLNQSSGEQVTITIGLQGLVVQAHDVRIKLNGTDVGSMVFSDRDNLVSQFQVPHSLLREGKNTFTFTGAAPGSDFSCVDFIRMTYSRRFKALNDRLNFSTISLQPARVDGFTSSQIRVLDVTDTSNVKEMIVSPQSNGDGTFSFTLPAGSSRNFIAESANASKYQPQVVANTTSALNTATNAAQFVIIAHSSLFPAAETLKNLRQSQGITTKIVDVEDIFDEFGFGDHGPFAIKAFLNHAKNNWQTPPQYAMLLGDATFDAKDNTGFGGYTKDLVPTKLIDSLFTETASDDWLADFNDDGLAEIALGRVAVRTLAEANTVIGKIVNYDNLPAGSTIQNGALMVNDQPDGYDFESFTNQVRQQLPGNMAITTINRTPSNTATIRSLIQTRLNQGPGLVNYFGHGSVSAWTSAGILTNTDAATLTNGNKLPFWIALTCLNGSFIELTIESLAEAAQKNPNGGAIAVWASSGLTFPFGQVSISESFYQQEFGTNPPRVGDAIRQAKTFTTDLDILHLTVFFGDPTMRLR